MENVIVESLLRLSEYVEGKKWKGYDPYDALNSPLLSFLSFNNRSFRILYTQAMKRIPLNFRKSLFIKEGYNPKGMGLFLASYLMLYKSTRYEEYLAKAGLFIDWLINNSSPGYTNHCWGYNFHWQSRSFYAPMGVPTIVNTCFIANAFLDAYEILGDRCYLEIARSSCNFITKSLNIYKNNNGEICFSYTPFDNVKVHNANLLAASLLSRVYNFTDENVLLDYANGAVRFSIKYQNEDGSWQYGLESGQNYIDNFHTGFVLESLYDYATFSHNPDIMDKVILGLTYYRNTFFTKDGLPRYYNTSIYPIDIHSAAEGIITLTRLRNINTNNLEQAKEIALWTIKNMQDRKGYFYFQKHKYYFNKIPYMRWSQAWMFKALIYLSEALGILIH